MNTSAADLYVVRDRVRLHGPLAGSGLHLAEVAVPPGSGSPPHRHASPETFYVLEGEIAFGRFPEGGPPEVEAAGPGAVVRVEGWEGHNYANRGDVPARMLVVLEDSMVRFFRDLGTEAEPRPGPPSAAEIAAIMAACGRHGIEVMGGPPPG